jgi:hypothetical protein
MWVRVLAMIIVMTIGAVNDRRLEAQAAKADGSMTVSGAVSHLAYVHAFPKKVFGRPAVLLVFSDVALSAADAGNDTRLSELANAGKLHGMGILIGANSQGKQTAISNEIYDQGFHGRMSIGGEETFEPGKIDDRSCAGRLSLKPAKKFESGVTFTYDVTFEAPIES